MPAMKFVLFQSDCVTQWMWSGVDGSGTNTIYINISDGNWINRDGGNT